MSVGRKPPPKNPKPPIGPIGPVGQGVPNMPNIPPPPPRGNRTGIRPIQCCKVGTYDCAVPMAIKGRRQDIDYCIADIVAALNAANIPTVASCCGHEVGSGDIALEDGREISVHRPYHDTGVEP